MDDLTSTPWVWLAVIVITNAVQALGSLFWGKQVIKAKDGRIQGLEGQLTDERVLKDERIKGLEDQLQNERILHGETVKALEVQLSTKEDLLEDSIRMSPARIREEAVALGEMQEQEIERRGAKIKELEEQATDNLKTKAERDSGLEEIALLKREKAVLDAELEITRKFTAGVTFSHGWALRANPPPAGRYIPAAAEDLGHLHNYPEDPGKEGKSA